MKRIRFHLKTLRYWLRGNLSWKEAQTIVVMEIVVFGIYEYINRNKGEHDATTRTV